VPARSRLDSADRSKLLAVDVVVEDDPHFSVSFSFWHAQG
jgi:hypothetical protein